MNRVRAVTLVETLVVVVILGILLALLFPIVGAAKSAAYGTQETSQLKSLAVAHSNYEADYDDAVLATSIPLVASRYNPSSLMQITLDPFPKGWANERRTDPTSERKTPYKDSFPTLNMSAGAQFHEAFRESSTGGWLISAGASLPQLKDAVVFRAVAYKRLTFSGSVIRRHFQPDTTVKDRISIYMDRCFSDDPIIDDYLRGRAQ